MKKIAGFNRNIMGGKRPHKGITKLGHLTLAQRVLAQGKALEAYQKRVGQYKSLDQVIMIGKPAQGRSFYTYKMTLQD